MNNISCLLTEARDLLSADYLLKTPLNEVKEEYQAFQSKLLKLLKPVIRTRYEHNLTKTYCVTSISNRNKTSVCTQTIHSKETLNKLSINTSKSYSTRSKNCNTSTNSCSSQLRVLEKAPVELKPDSKEHCKAQDCPSSIKKSTANIPSMRESELGSNAVFTKTMGNSPWKTNSACKLDAMLFNRSNSNSPRPIIWNRGKSSCSSYASEEVQPLANPEQRHREHGALADSKSRLKAAPVNNSFMLKKIVTSNKFSTKKKQDERNLSGCTAPSNSSRSLISDETFHFERSISIDTMSIRELLH